jgi:hypothetical protein
MLARERYACADILDKSCEGEKILIHFRKYAKSNRLNPASLAQKI